MSFYMLAIKTLRYIEQNQVLLEHGSRVAINAANIWRPQNIILQAPNYCTKYQSCFIGVN